MEDVIHTIRLSFLLLVCEVRFDSAFDVCQAEVGVPWDAQCSCLSNYLVFCFCSSLDDKSSLR
ncbi:unnamed protein product [Musa acuminata subsp. burmannicoides]